MSDRDDELLRHLGTLWRTAMVGLDTLREVAVRSTQAGRLRVDIALLQRERSQLLETLGEMVVAMIDDGSFEDVPESLSQAYDRIKDVESRLKTDDAKAHDNAFGAPRGFEPEAASDYGDHAAHDDEDESHEDHAHDGEATDHDGHDSSAQAEAAHADTKRPRKAEAKSNGKRKVNHS